MKVREEKEEYWNRLCIDIDNSTIDQHHLGKQLKN